MEDDSEGSGEEAEDDMEEGDSTHDGTPEVSGESLVMGKGASKPLGTYQG